MLQNGISSSAGLVPPALFSLAEPHFIDSLYDNYADNTLVIAHHSDFRKRGLFVGSGVMEAGCRTLVAQRLKPSGMHWTVKGADNIIALRCCILSNRWEDFWEDRAVV
jgi:hypothetical protein